MGQVLHGCATTTHAVRTAIQRSKAPLKELAARYGLNHNIACVAETLAKCAQPIRLGVERCWVEKSDHRHRRLLRSRCQWAGQRRAAEHRDELAAGAHSITSSARASSDGGTLRPSAFGGLEIDSKLELGRLQKWQICGFGAAKDAADIDAGLIILIQSAGTVTHQAAGTSKFASAVDCWYGVARSKRSKNVTSVSEQCIVRHDKCACTLLR